MKQPSSPSTVLGCFVCLGGVWLIGFVVVVCFLWSVVVVGGVGLGFFCSNGVLGDFLVQKVC